MGQFESHPDANDGLRVLFDLNQQCLDFTLAKLEDLSKNRYQNQVSMWDLMSHLQISMDKFKSLAKLLSNNANSKNLSVHLLMVALVICQESPDPDQMLEKVPRIFSLISFMVYDGQIQRQEVSYIFHLVELWITAITQGGLAKGPSVSSNEARVILKQLENELFADSEDDEAPLDQVIDILQKQPGTQILLQSFQPDLFVDRLIDERHSRKKSTHRSVNMNSSQGGRVNSAGTVTEIDAARGDINMSQHLQSDPGSVKGGILTPEGSPIAKHLDTPGSSQHRSQTVDQKPAMQDRVVKRASNEHDDIQSHLNGRVTGVHMSPSIADSPMSPTVMKAKNLGSAIGGANHDELYWTTDVVYHVINAYSAKMLQQEHDLRKIGLMQEKLTCYRQVTNKLMGSDWIENLKDLKFKLDKVNASNIEFFGHRQLANMMRNYFFEQQLVNTGFSIYDYTQLQMKRIREGEDDMKDMDDDKFFEEQMSRGYLGQAFHEFYKQSLCQLKYELRTGNIRMLHYASTRGQQRLLEKKKYKTLGEIASLCQIMLIMDENTKHQPPKVVAGGSHLNSNPSQTEVTPEKNLASSKSVSQASIGAGSAIPDHDQIFTLVYAEIQKLRTCKMSRRDLVSHMVVKEERRSHANQISFWEGVLAIIDEAAQVKTFNKLERFTELQDFAQRNLITQEAQHKQSLIDRQHHRQAFLKYNTQIGKIKGLTLAVKQSTEAKRNEELFKETVKNRRKKLMGRLESLDFQLTNMMHTKIMEKRTAKSYFKSVGKHSTYKTVAKSLPCERIFDFLIMEMAKMRVQEIILIVAHQDKHLHMQNKVKQPILLAALQKMIAVEQLDKAFNLGNAKIESKADLKTSHARFQDELNQIAEMQRLMAEAPDHPIIEALGKHPVHKQALPTVAAMLAKQYSEMRVDLNELKLFAAFAGKKAGYVPMMPIGSLTYKDKSQTLEDAGKVLFNFVDLEDRKDVKTDDLISWLGTLSCSLKTTYFHAQVERLISASQEAHQNCQQFACKLQSYTEVKYLGGLNAVRIKALTEFTLNLQGANRGSLINNMDYQYMSLPLEYSLENNFWLVQALQRLINRSVKEAKFQQYCLVHSPILLSRRALSLNKKIAAQLILAAFDIGPQSVQGSERSENEEEVYFKDKSDFSKQHGMTMGKAFLDLRTKRFLLGDIEEFLRVRQRVSEQKQRTRTQFIQIENKYQIPGKDNLAILVRDLIDDAFDVENTGTIDQIVVEFDKAKQERFDEMKKKAIEGVIGGARHFLDKLIKMQTKENSFGQNQTLLKFKDFITQMHQTVTGVKPINPTMSIGSTPNGGNADNIIITPGTQQTPGGASRNLAEQQISLSTGNNSDGTALSFFNANAQRDAQKSPAKVARAGTRKSKKKITVLSPFEEGEDRLIRQLAKTSEIYDLVQQARSSPNLATFFLELKNQYNQDAKLAEKITSTHQFLKSNIEVSPQSTLAPAINAKPDVQMIETQKQLNELKIHTDRIGCKITQHVQACTLISPTFVFQPENNATQGMPPLCDQRVSEGNEFQHSSQPSAGKNTARNMTKLDEEDQSADEQRSILSESGLAKSALSNEHSSIVVQAMQGKQLELSEHQKAINLTFQFTDQISQLDDKLTMKMLNKSDSILVYLQGATIEMEQKQAAVTIQGMIWKLQHELINVFDLDVTPLDIFLKSFQRTQKFIMRDMQAVSQGTDQGFMRVFFDNIIARADASLIKQAVSRVDSYYGNVTMDDQDKLDFLTAQTKIKRELDQKLHTFKEFADLEENKKNYQRHGSLIEHQQKRICQEIAQLNILIRQYYIKQRYD